MPELSTGILTVFNELEEYSQITPEIEQALPGRIVPRDLEEYRRRKETERIEISELIPESDTSLEDKASEEWVNTLPTPSTCLVGREQEVAKICGLLQNPEVRLLTLTGPAGTGKTRLGLQVARQKVGDFANGVFFVALAPITAPGLVATTIAQALGIKEAAGKPVIENLKIYLRGKQILLVLDNFEQVIAAGPVVTELLAAAPGLKVLVTSREVLHVYGEREFSVPPLVLPDLKSISSVEALAQSEAVALFIQRAQAVKPDFVLTPENASAVAEICVRLDGLPLAIELAAARSKLLSTSALLARLHNRLALLTSGARDLPPRQQTLRGAIDWSYELLNDAEKKLFARLGVFVGGCTVEAAEAVAGIEEDANIEVLEGLGSLIDKSLLRQVENARDCENSRLVMLEMLREYAGERLTESGEEEKLRLRHAEYYMNLAEAAEQGLKGAGQLRWLERIEAEYDNLRAALGWAIERMRKEEKEKGEGMRKEEKSGFSPSPSVVAARLSGALGWFWYTHNHLNEGRRWLDMVLAANQELQSYETPEQAKVVYMAGFVARNQGDVGQAVALFEKGLATCREMGDRPGTAESLYGLGAVAWVQAEYSRARMFLEESLLVYGELGDKWGCARSLHGLGETLLGQGDYKVARVLFEESLNLFRQLGDKLHGTFALLRLGTLAWYQNEYERAQKLLEESLKLFGEAENKWGSAYSLLNLGGVACDRGDSVQAVRLLEESLSLFREIGYKSGIAGALNYLGLAKLQQGHFEQVATACQESFELRKELGDKPGMGHCLEILARVGLAQGRAKEAARLLGAADALRQALNAPLLPTLHNQHEQTLTVVRTQLGKAEFAAAWAQGQNTEIYDLRTLRVPAIYDFKAEGYDFAATPVEPITWTNNRVPVKKAEEAKPIKPAETVQSSIVAASAHQTGCNRQSSIPGLTAREIEVLRLVAQGLTNAQVAQKLTLASRTVNVHLTSIYGKLGVSSRVGATRYVFDHNLM